MGTPAVTVLMPAFNAARHIAEAVNSVLTQTFKDFELLVINDGSSDGTDRILRSYSDRRIRIIDNDRNLGLIASLNKGLELAQSEYVARMDADDICHSRRLATQVAFMRNRPEVGVVGTWYRPIARAWSRAVRLPVGHEDICSWMPFHSPIAHPTVVMRRKLFVEKGLHYDPFYLHAEDYDLWSRASRLTRLANIPQILLYYRTHLGQVTSKHDTLQGEKAKLVRGRELARLLPDVSPAQVDFHHEVLSSQFERDLPTLALIEAWLTRLLQENERTGAFPLGSFRDAVGRVWRAASLYCMPHAWAYARYSRSALTGLTSSRIPAVAGFSVRALKRIASKWTSSLAT